MAGEQDFYSGGMDGEEAPEKAPETMEEGDPNETKDEKTEEEGAGESALLPKSILAGKDFNPGDELVLKVVAIHGDEVEVEYAKESGKKDNPYQKKDAAPMGKARAGMMDRMAGFADQT